MHWPLSDHFKHITYYFNLLLHSVLYTTFHFDGQFYLLKFTLL